CCKCDAALETLYSFPTRRSSDLGAARAGAVASRRAARAADTERRVLRRAQAAAHGPGRAARACVARAQQPAGLSVPSRVLHRCADRKSTRLNSSHVKISYAVFCL